MIPDKEVLFIYQKEDLRFCLWFNDIKEGTANRDLKIGKRTTNRSLIRRSDSHITHRHRVVDIMLCKEVRMCTELLMHKSEQRVENYVYGLYWLVKHEYLKIGLLCRIVRIC